MKRFIQTTLFLLPAVVALFALSACQPTRATKHKTWVDLAEISSQVSKAKEDNPSEPAFEGNPYVEKAEKEKAPKVRKVEVKKEATTNPYLTDKLGKKEIHTGENAEGEGVMLNFDNADIYEVIQVIAEVLDINYIIDPQVKGVVNIRSGQKIPNDQLFIIFKKILNINGLDIRDEGDHYYIYVAGKPSSLAVYGKDEIGKLKNSAKLVTQIVPVMHISSAEAQKLIEPYLSEQAVIYNLADQNILVISDYEGQIIDALMILSRIDVSSLSSLVVRLVRIDNASLFDVKDELTEVLDALKVNKKDYTGVQILPLERVNSLLLIGYNEELMSTALKWVEELDKPITAGRNNIFIYNVRNSVASELADLVTSLIEDKGTSAKKSSTRSRGITSKLPTRPGSARATKSITKKTRTRSLPRIKKASATGGADLQFAGEPTLIADDSRNVILVKALPSDYKRVLKLIERLDNMPMQVLVEVMVAEVQLSDDLKYGVEWALQNSVYKINDAKISYDSTKGLGFSLLSDSTEIFNLLQFLASNNDFSILSSPQVLVLNNEAATVNVGEQVPIVTSETSDVSNGSTSNRTVQYKDTGVILNVTPRINYDGIILLDIDQEVSKVKSETTEGIASPVITTKKVKTKLAVRDGQSILIGGLIDKTETESESGIPVLKDIPYLGWLFKEKSVAQRKTELLIMVTPYVIENSDVLKQYIENFQEKMHGLRKELDTFDRDPVHLLKSDL